MTDNDNLNLDWLAPVLGFVGLLAGTLFFSSSNKDNSNNNNNIGLPPPPVGQKPSSASDCGCQHKKT
jgi:hypothetical protein